MNERIRELAEQAGFVLWLDTGPFNEVIDWASNYEDELEKFAELIRADEREACAKVCEDLIGTRAMARHCADAIRARGEAEYGRGEPISHREPQPVAWMKVWGDGTKNFYDHEPPIFGKHKTYALYARPVHASDMSKEPVDETVKDRHISYVCPNCHWSLNRQEPDEDIYDIWKEKNQ